jgi:hypothetical protein
MVHMTAQDNKLELPYSERDLLDSFDKIHKRIERMAQGALGELPPRPKETPRGPHGSFPLVREASSKYEVRSAL